MRQKPLEDWIWNIRNQRAFVRLREQVAANQTILKRLAEIDRTLLQHDGAWRDLYHNLLPLLQPPPEAGNRIKLGFSRESTRGP